jgi:hypothetical protein
MGVPTAIANNQANQMSFFCPIAQPLSLLSNYIGPAAAAQVTRADVSVQFQQSEQCCFRCPSLTTDSMSR